MSQAGSVPRIKPKIRWQSGSGVLLIVSTLALISFAAWALLTAAELKQLRRVLSERAQWRTEIHTAVERLETPPLRFESSRTSEALQALNQGLLNLRLSLEYPNEPSAKLLTRIDVTLIDVQAGFGNGERTLASFRKSVSRNLRRAQSQVRTEIVEHATRAPALVQAVNQGLSGATILCGMSLMLLVFSLHRGEESSLLYANLEAVNEELIHLRRSQEQHYKQTFSSITDNLDHGVILYRRNEILFANEPLTLLIRPGAKSWEDVEPELDVLLERTHAARHFQQENHELPGPVVIMARRFDGSAIEVSVEVDRPTIYRGGDAQMAFVHPLTTLPSGEMSERS